MDNEKIVNQESSADMTEIIGVRYRNAGKVYYFNPGPFKVNVDDCVIVETQRGQEYGYVAIANTMVPTESIVPPFCPVIRIADEADKEHNEDNKRLEEEAIPLCKQKIAELGLDMKLIDVKYTFDNSRLYVYYFAESRVDFREFVKEFGHIIRTRVEMRQIPIRDAAKMMGGLGVCGRPFCCSSFLSDFVQVSIKMAKEQNLSLNSLKISGTCGRLMCCLRFEHETYEEEIKRTPPVDSTVKTAEGIGTVTEISPLTGFIKVKIGDNIKPFHRDSVTVLSHGHRESGSGD